MRGVFMTRTRFLFIFWLLPLTNHEVRLNNCVTAYEYIQRALIAILKEHSSHTLCLSPKNPHPAQTLIFLYAFVY